MGNLKLRSEDIGDVGHITQIHDQAFKSKAEGQLVNLIRDSNAFVSELSIVADENGVLVGHVLLSKINLIEEGKDSKSLSLAPIAVVPDHQKRGVGKALIQEGIRRARSLGFSSILVLGDPKYYGKFGFRHDLAKGIICKYQCPDLQGLELSPGTLTSLTSATATYPAAFFAVD